jgi:hypothetical protein
MIHALEHSLIDSLIVFIITYILLVLISFFEIKIHNLLVKNKKTAPIAGALVGLVPQCGIPVVCSDMYIRRHITIGTLVAVFISASDETLPILFSNKDTILDGFILIAIKFVYGIIIGFLVDIIFKNKEDCTLENHNCETHDCHHHDEKGFGYKHFVHPLIHSLYIFIFVFIVSFIFNTIIHFITEEAFNEFLTSNKYLSPLFTTLVALIPNCSSSVIITELYILGGIPFSALLSGSVVNAGLGLLFLFKKKTKIKDVFVIYTILIVASLVLGYFVLFLKF